MSFIKYSGAANNYNRGASQMKNYISIELALLANHAVHACMHYVSVVYSVSENNISQYNEY